MDLQLTGKRALVTGASAGTGTGTVIATTLAAEGARVAVHGRDPDRTAEVCHRIREAGGTAEPVLGDLSTSDGAARIARRCREALGGIDILVNNAGAIGHYQCWDDTTDTTWARFYDQVVLVTVRMVQALLPDLRRAGWGRIVTLSSAQSGQPFAMMPDYAAAKLALLAMSKSLSKELDRSGVTVNSITPGIIATATIRDRLTEAARAEGRSTAWADVQDHVLATELDNPTGRFADPQDVADLVAFLVSPRAGYINGTNVRIDGGSDVTVAL